MAVKTPPSLRYHPLDPKRWKDFEELFGRRGACGGCWCMWWRVTHANYLDQRGDGNKRAMKKLARSGCAPGIIAYAGRQPVGWCAIAPRTELIRLAGSRVLKPVDENPVWSVTCFFVAKTHRGRGITSGLLKTAVKFAARQGAKTVEGYPVDPRKKQPDVFVYTGLASAFRYAGFVEVARRSPTRPIMRLEIN